MPYHSSDIITVALEVKLLARKRVVGLEGSIPVLFNSKENLTIQAILNKYVNPARAEIDAYIKLTRSNDDSNNHRANRCRTNEKDS